MTVTCTWTCEGNSLLLWFNWTKVSVKCVWNSHVLIVLKQIFKNSLNILNRNHFFQCMFLHTTQKYYCVLHWFIIKWNIQIMWYPEPYLDSIITKYCDLIQECLFSTFWISKKWLQFVMMQGVPDNRFNVCEELTFSRTFRKNSTERNKHAGFKFTT